jgi:GTP-binding protein YchF
MIIRVPDETGTSLRTSERDKGVEENMKLGVVGLPNVGKSTLFNAITKAGAQAENYPFCTIEPNTGMVMVPDDRLQVLADMYHPKKVTPTTIEFVDIAGLVKGASRGEGLGNKFLSHIREVDAIVHVVRCFEDENIIHVDGSVDPARDIETINLELIFADMETVLRRKEKAQKNFRGGDKKSGAEADLAEAIYAHLEKGQPARTYPADEEEKAILASWFLLTTKPVIYAANISEDDLGKDESEIPFVQSVRSIAEAEKAEMIVISAAIEEDIAQMDPEEKQEFLQELGIGQSGLDRLITACYHLLGLISFLTAGEDECRAWTITRGTKAPQAAGKIHTDFEKGFIRAEVVPFDTLAELGSMAACREKGLIRSEGKDYVMKDGDITLFRFNV